MCRKSWKSGSLNLLEPSRPQRACNGTTLPLPINVCMSLPLDLKAHSFCTRRPPDMHGCMQRGVFGRAMDWAMYMTKLWRTSSASYSINTHLHLKLRFSTKFIVAQDNPYKSENVSKIGACGQFAILQAIPPLVFDKRCGVFWTVICSETCLLCLSIRWQVCHVLWNAQTNSGFTFVDGLVRMCVSFQVRFQNELAI
jgi:hypothetical protein